MATEEEQAPLVEPSAPSDEMLEWIERESVERIAREVIRDHDLPYAPLPNGVLYRDRRAAPTQTVTRKSPPTVSLTITPVEP